ncbi:MAG TPA: DUF72 domain-containing protein [Labilithrix sp.]|jgi:uncharacterized protein YecE (DUF72 family)|nr:DUF72 domain-containing protein [Labilithrix sp.]
MATRVHIGSKELRGELAAYAKRFDLLEVRGVDASNLRLAPTAATMRRWRKAVPPQFEFGVVAGPNVGKLKPSEAFEAELEAMLASATVLESRLLVVPTPQEVTPSKLWRDRFAKLLDRLPRDASTVVWEPSGLWEHEDAAVQAKKWGVVLSVDPTRDIVPVGPVAFARLRALGGTRAYSTAALEKVAAAIGSRRDAYVIIETQGALKEGKTLRRLVRAAASRQTGGLSRLVRPRGAAPIQFTDDEQDE